MGVRCPFGPMWCPYMNGGSIGDTPVLLGAAHANARMMNKQPYYNRWKGDVAELPPCSNGLKFPVPLFCERETTKPGVECDHCGHYSSKRAV